MKWKCSYKEIETSPANCLKCDREGCDLFFEKIHGYKPSGIREKDCYFCPDCEGFTVAPNPAEVTDVWINGKKLGVGEWSARYCLRCGSTSVVITIQGTERGTNELTDEAKGNEESDPEDIRRP